MNRDEERALDLANDELLLRERLMEERTFTYKGYTFKPIGNILGGFKIKTSHTTWAYSLTIDGYTHEDFYKVAKKHHASVDVYEVNGKLYIPCNKSFMGIYNNPKIKTIEQYERWYQ